MRLSQLIGKPVFVGETQRGTFQGVFLSVKSKAIKYLLCNIQQKKEWTHSPLLIKYSFQNLLRCNTHSLF